MKPARQFFALLLSFAVVMQIAPTAKACGPGGLIPIYVFEDSPDPPFQEFAQGNIGIVKPSFGRKTLVIAYRYLNGGSFNSEEQKSLIEALKGTRPEKESEEAVKTWLAARTEVLKDETELPNIYRASDYGGYDFFPNCTSNAFEVATDTLKDRAGRFGADAASVREWVKGQDTVFRNCGEGAQLPAPVGSASPDWLRKDRDYQIAAALFYSLQFDEALWRFELIAKDVESDWQETANYLVGRTLVRQASLEKDEKAKRNIYERAEAHLVNLLGRTSKFRSGTQKLIALIRYRTQPEARVRELAQILTQSGDENLRYDLIDYVWLLDKFDEQIQKEEEERKKLLNTPKPDETAPANQEQVERDKKFDAVQRGELIQVWMNVDKGDGQVNTSLSLEFFFKPDATESEIREKFEAGFGRKLSDNENIQLAEQLATALQLRAWKLSPNRKLNQYGYEGCAYDCNNLPLDLLPSFLRLDELTDWIFTFQSKDPTTYSHALTKWRETQSEAWFVAALTKATAKTTPRLQRLLTKAQTIQPDTPLFATVAYQRIRLLTELGKKAEARQLWDQAISTRLEAFPASARNEFVEQRMQLAQNLTEFLRFASRKPVVFYEYGSMGTIAELVSFESDPETPEVNAKESERREQLLKWDGRSVFDERVVEVMNWHFPLSQLMSAAHDSALPDYSRQRLLFTIWTRAVLLKNEKLAQQAASEIVDLGIDSSGVFAEYVKAGTQTQKLDAATFALLKSPTLSPYIASGVPDLDTGDDGYYFELGWWCTLSETTYDDEYKEVPLRVPSPSFLTVEFLTAAEKERSELRAIGDGKRYLGNRVIEWAKQRPRDSRLPEALFIAIMANQSYKYGCGGWERDEEIRQEAMSLLKENYPGSVWALKLREMEQQGLVQ